MHADKNQIPNKQLRRTMGVIKALIRKPHGMTPQEIFEELLNSDIPSPTFRTLQRDLNEIEALGYEIERIHEGRQLKYKLVNREEIIGAWFTTEEVQALMMGRSLFRYFKGTHLKQTLDNAISLITDGQRLKYSKDELETLADAFTVHLGPHRDFSEKLGLFDDIVHAVNNRFVLRIRYHAQGKEEDEFEIHPYRIVLYHDSLYLLARKKETLILFHISRIASAVETAEQFIRDQTLLDDYDERLSHCFGIAPAGTVENVEIHFHRSVVGAVKERCWHSSQLIHEEVDRIILKMRVYANYELAAWVLSWGNVVLEIKPEQFSNLVKSKIIQPPE